MDTDRTIINRWTTKHAQDTKFTVRRRSSEDGGRRADFGRRTAEGGISIFVTAVAEFDPESPEQAGGRGCRDR